MTSFELAAAASLAMTYGGPQNTFAFLSPQIVSYYDGFAPHCSASAYRNTCRSDNPKAQSERSPHILIHMKDIIPAESSPERWCGSHPARLATPGCLPLQISGGKLAFFHKGLDCCPISLKRKTVAETTFDSENSKQTA